MSAIEKDLRERAAQTTEAMNYLAKAILLLREKWIEQKLLELGIRQELMDRCKSGDMKARGIVRSWVEMNGYSQNGIGPDEQTPYNEARLYQNGKLVDRIVFFEPPSKDYVYRVLL